MDKINSIFLTIEDIVREKISFNIPRYQRLYVWKDEQVKTFFNDILTACQSEKEEYFIGGVMGVKEKCESGECIYDLVDGQQRFTTLWLMANELGGDLQSFTRNTDQKLRLRFAIRDKVEAYFEGISRIEEDGEVCPGEFEDLVRIGETRLCIQSLISEQLKGDAQREDFVHFLMQKVRMIFTEVPVETDLNKLFETLNNRGIQLAQHEILKASLLGKIQNKERRYHYGVLWNACCDMENYIERSLALEIGSFKSVADTFDRWEKKHDWVKIEDLLKNREVSKMNNLSLGDIVKKCKETGAEKVETDRIDENDFAHPDAGNDEFEPVRSILSFSQLLLHTLRIFLYDKGQEDIVRINEKELLDIFEDHLFKTEYQNEGEKARDEEQESLGFLNLLFVIREVFDCYVIKWVKVNEKEEVHLIKEVVKQNQKRGGWTYYLRRLKAKNLDGLALLESVLYHSQQNTTQYWLTPFLRYLRKWPSFEDAYRRLKCLDNILFSSLRDDKLLTQRTWECMGETLPDIKPTTRQIAENDRDWGTDFPHYWFYKLEFVLWHEREVLGRGKEWENYRMTARNSVEHISPQNPRDQADRLCVAELHHFGNLVLVTRGINSEYSDLPYRVKQAKFKDKKEKGSYDSLKSDLVYESSTWGDREALNHQQAMVRIMEGYFAKTR